MRSSNNGSLEAITQAARSYVQEIKHQREEGVTLDDAVISPERRAFEELVKAVEQFLKVASNTKAKAITAIKAGGVSDQSDFQAMQRVIAATQENKVSDQVMVNIEGIIKRALSREYTNEVEWNLRETRRSIEG